MKRLAPSAEGADSSDEEEEDGEDGNDGGDHDENAPARANVPEPAPAAGKEAAALGSIEVKDGPSEQKREELRAFLETELPEIQRNVALRARTLWWKQKEYDDKIEDTRSKLKEVQRLIEAIEPGVPSMASTGEVAVPTV